MIIYEKGISRFAQLQMFYERHFSSEGKCTEKKNPINSKCGGIFF